MESNSYTYAVVSIRRDYSKLLKSIADKLKEKME